MMNELEISCADYIAGLNLCTEGNIPMFPDLEGIIEEVRYELIFDRNLFRKEKGRKRYDEKNRKCKYRKR